MSIRQRQIESVLKRAISEVLGRRLADPRIRGMVSITHIEVRPDLRQAVVYVSVLPQEYSSLTLHGLTDASGRIHRLIRKSITARTMPHLRFELDESIKKEAAVFDAIREGFESVPPDPEESAP
jgi:ribosome-binding factor A